MLGGGIRKRLAWWFVYLGPRRDVTVDTFNGLLTFDSKDWLIGKVLYIKRSYEANEIRGTMALLRREGYLHGQGRGTVLDVGANVGMICVALLKHGYFERAVAFEPAPNSYRLLVQNVNQNGMGERIRHLPVALSSEEGELDLELSQDNSGDHRIRNTSAPGISQEERRRTVRVPVKTLDRVFAEQPTLHADDVALVWLDIQGYEGQFFAGAARLLSRGVSVVSEFWPYAIRRSGMLRSNFCGIVSGLFTHFYRFHHQHYEKLPIAELDGLFDAYSSPRQMCQVVLVSDRCRKLATL